nr:solute carrier family 26 member 6-like [Cherax quadricarinatus]
MLRARVPVLSWLPAYNVTSCLPGDLLAGITVAIMHIPQGMGSALLGGLPPITGIYMAFFPVLLYSLLGTSRHISLGTFAIVSLMLGNVIEKVNLVTTDSQSALARNLTDTLPALTDTLPVMTDTLPVMTDTLPVTTDTLPVTTDTLPVTTDTLPVTTDTLPVTTDALPVTTDTLPTMTGTLPPMTGTLPTNSTLRYTPSQVAAIVALVCGIVEVVLGVVSVGNLSVFLSDMLVSGFTTAAAVQVLVSQLKYLLGVHVRRYDGPFNVIYILQDTLAQVLSSNPATVFISALTMAVLVINNELVKPWLRKKTKFPLPIELIVVASATLCSYLANLHRKYNIEILGEIPTGLPKPTPPPFELLPAVAMDSVFICVISFTVSFSMAKIFAKRHNYPIDATQELYAMGVSNFFGSFFGCAPISASFSRTLILEGVGGKTQLSSLVCCSLLLFVLLFVGPLFETLPNCVLSSIIIVAIKGMFMQVADLKKVWAMSHADALIWLTTFLGVVIIDINYGLLMGIVMSLLVLVGRSHKPKTVHLGQVPNTDVYLDVNKYSMTAEVPRVKIYQFCGPLHFANCEYFREQLVSVTGLNPATIVAAKLSAVGQQQQQQELEYQQQKIEAPLTSQLSKEMNGTSDSAKTIERMTSRTLWGVEYLVVEMSAVSYTDSSGGNLLSQLYKEYQEAGITVCLAALSESVLEMLESCGTLKVIPSEHIFHSAHDAVTTLTHDNPCCGDNPLMHSHHNPSSDDTVVVLNHRDSTAADVSISMKL